MDRLIYIAMSGAKHTLLQQAAVTQNLANAVTTGYRAETNAFRALPVFGEGVPTRAFVVDSTIGANFAPGAIQHTGRDLDVALQGAGWIAVQTPDGGEAYTRNGSLQVGPNGLLQTRNGLTVLGDSGPIAIPPDTGITVGKDGTISTVPIGQNLNAVNAVGRIKLVNPAETDLVRGADGLFRVPNTPVVPADAGVTLIAGSLETSNVSVVDALVGMISLARQFDTQIKLLQSAEANATKASSVMNLNA